MRSMIPTNVVNERLSALSWQVYIQVWTTRLYVQQNTKTVASMCSGMCWSTTRPACHHERLGYARVVSFDHGPEDRTDSCVCFLRGSEGSLLAHPIASQEMTLFRFSFLVAVASRSFSVGWHWNCCLDCTSIGLLAMSMQCGVKSRVKAGPFFYWLEPPMIFQIKIPWGARQ